MGSVDDGFRYRLKHTTVNIEEPVAQHHVSSQPWMKITKVLVAYSQWPLWMVGHLISWPQNPRILFRLKSPSLCRLNALRRDVWSCLAVTTVSAWFPMWMVISAATTPATSYSWSMRVLRKRKTREHPVVCKLADLWGSSPGSGDWAGRAYFFPPGGVSSWHLYLLKGLSLIGPIVQFKMRSGELQPCSALSPLCLTSPLWMTSVPSLFGFSRCS